MPHEIIMPKLGLTMKTGTIVDWFKHEGESVGIKDPLIEIETEKLSYSIESPADGILLKAFAVAGEKYPVRTVLGYIGQPGDTIPEPSIGFAANNIAADSAPAGSAQGNSASVYGAPANDVSVNSAITGSALINGISGNDSNVGTSFSPGNSEFRIPNSEFTPSGRIFISPVAKNIAAKNGLDYRLITGTGPNGRIVKADVLRYIETGANAAAIESNFTNAAALSHLGGQQPETETIVPYRGLRRATGETMLRAWTTIPMVTHHVNANAGALSDYRIMLNADVTDKMDRVTIGELLLKLTAVALSMVPTLNSSLTDKGIIVHSRIHLGMATAIDDGLVVPVIQDAGRKGLLALSREAKDLAARARSGKLSPDEILGATFTVSNLGGFDSVDHFTPIINPPQAAILGIGRMSDTVVPVNGEIKIRPMIGLSLTYDHRIVDGATAAIFIKTLMKLMDKPARAVLATNE